VPTLRAAGRSLAPAIGAAALPPPLAAHGGPIAPHQVWSAWNPDPLALLVIGIAAFGYALGSARLRQRARAGRGIAPWRFRSYVCGLLILFVALVSPVDALGETLFAMHMVQHELLIVLAAPLLVLGAPLNAWIWALPHRWRVGAGSVAKRTAVRGTWQAITHPLAAWTLHAIALVVWHIPVLYQATLSSPTVHLLQHLSFFGTAILFWGVLLHPVRFRRLSPGPAVLYLFTTALYGSALGALLTFSPAVWYPIYGERAAAWGLTALEDQQLGGLIMWIPFGLVYTLVALALFASWFRRMDAAPGTSPQHPVAPRIIA
jgi:putative membrane protein